MGIINLIAKSNYITFNKPLAKKIGVNSAIVFGELCSISLLNNDNEFFYQKERIEEDTCLGEQAVRSAIKTLSDYQLISVTKKGIPCKYWYKINENKLIEVLEVTTSDATTDTTGDMGSDTTGDATTDTTVNNNNKNKNKNNNKDSDTSNSEQKAILSSYFMNCKKLYEQGKIQTDKPVLIYGQIGKQIKSLLQNITLEDIIRCINNAMNDNWLVSKGYLLNMILSDNQINKLINITEKSQVSNSGIIGYIQPDEDREYMRKLIQGNNDGE